jgi:aerobic carbon-monoxide dehydrogenase medium subunit
MIPAPFDYVRAGSVAEAVSLITADEDAKLLAGGHSLVPLMKLRLAAPSRLVDIGRIAELSYVCDAGDHIAIGALTRHCTLQADPVIRSGAGLLAAAAAEVGDPQVRHRGTIGGSVAHGDPASDLPAALLALDARYLVTGPAGSRTISAADFHLGFLQTALQPAEVLTEIRVPAGARQFAFRKFRARASDWALVGAAAASGPAGVRIGLVNMGPAPLRARRAEAAIAGGARPADAAQLAAEGTDPPGDLAATADFRRHLARVLVAQVLSELAGSPE